MQWARRPPFQSRSFRLEWRSRGNCRNRNAEPKKLQAASFRPPEHRKLKAQNAIFVEGKVLKMAGTLSDQKIYFVKGFTKLTVFKMGEEKNRNFKKMFVGLILKKQRISAQPTILSTLVDCWILVGLSRGLRSKLTTLVGHIKY